MDKRIVEGCEQGFWAEELGEKTVPFTPQEKASNLLLTAGGNQIVTRCFAVSVRNADKLREA